MIRWVGALLLTAGAGALGAAAVAQLEGRVRDLRETLRGLEGMKRLLDSSMEPLERMLREAEACTTGRVQALFRFCVREMDPLKGEFSALWQAALDTVPLRMEEADLAELRQLGNILGRYDVDSQSAALKQTLSRMERLLEDAAGQRARLGKVYGTAGVAAGLLLAIMLL